MVLTETQYEMRSFEKDLCEIANLHRFRHDAMAATFEVFIIHEDSLYAEQAAQAAFEELDRIENNLSRFVENSDVSRINSLGKGRPLQIGLSTFECLQTSVDMCRQTNGAFDITLGQNLMKLDELNHTIELLNDGVKIDLGGIGKGYAADKIKQVLADWGIAAALISAGQSTVLPIGKPAGLPGWPVSICDPADNRVLANIYMAGADSTCYIIGDDVLAQAKNAETPKYLLYDGHGSTRQLVNSAGSGVLESYSYDAYGVMLGGNPGGEANPNPAQTNMLYTGEQWDTSAQQYYLRARYYDPLNGRFNQVDPFAGSPRETRDSPQFSPITKGSNK